MSEIELDYDSLMQDALRRVVKDVLSITQELQETPGEHHFYIEFLTGALGVSIPEHLRDAYPSRMTIVLHHQFENLEVSEDGFEVTLWFKGIEARLVIPFEAMTSFADPSAKFGLRFHEDDADLEEMLSDDDDDGLQPGQDAPSPEGNGSDENEDAEEEQDQENAGADVVSLDSFRRK